MAIEVFNRYENKYLVDTALYEKLRGRLSDYMEVDNYNKGYETYPICNVYFDTDDNYLIRTSLKKPRYKEKLRLRSYGTPDAGSKVYVEIKKKVCKLVNKRRSALRLGEAYEFLKTAELPEIYSGQNRQVLREIKYMLGQHELKPKLYLAYERRAYFNEGSHDLRVSFDTSVIVRRDDLFLESGIYGECLLKEDQWIMEVKTAGNIPVWLARILAEYRVYPTSFSKYGTEYKNRIGNGRSERSVFYIPMPAAARILLPV